MQNFTCLASFAWALDSYLFRWFVSPHHSSSPASYPTRFRNIRKLTLNLFDQSINRRVSSIFDILLIVCGNILFRMCLAAFVYRFSFFFCVVVCTYYFTFCRVAWNEVTHRKYCSCCCLGFRGRYTADKELCERQRENGIFFVLIQSGGLIHTKIETNKNI